MDTIDNRTFKEKFLAWKASISVKIKGIWNWIKCNPFSAFMYIIYGCTAASAVIGVGGQVNKFMKENRKLPEDRRVWDPVHGFYWPLKRPMTTQEKLEFEDLVKQGYDRGTALEKMGLLSRKYRF